MTRKNTKQQSFIIIALAGILAGCSGGKVFKHPQPLPPDTRPIPEPKSRHINIAEDAFDRQFVEQVEQSFDLSRQFRNLSGQPKQALNVNAMDEADNSSWFTNRNFMQKMTLEKIANGPNQGDGPDKQGPWTVIGAKTEGVTPGFSIKDSKGTRFLLKFDPPGYSEMATGAELVSTKLFYGAGYNVPQNYLVFFDPEILKMGEGVLFTDARGEKRAMTREDLAAILKRIEIQPDGRIRAVASKFIEGKLKGPFRYKGTRDDDPNDIVPHQHRRELRGLRVIASWLNHFDTKANNSLDVYTKQKYIKHYLIDFGSTLGSNGDEPMPPEIGYENSFDPHEVGLNLLSLGFYVRPYEKNWKVEYPSIGYFRADLFEPQEYKFIQPNPAFELMTDRDGYWGAKIVMSFTDEQIRTAIKQGQYSNPEAADYLFRVIKERRDLIGRYWFKKMNPLDKFEILDGDDGTQLFCFGDLAIEYGLATEEQSSYRYRLLQNGKMVSPAHELQGATCIQLTQLTASDTRKSGGSGEDQWAIALETRREGKNKWSKRVTVYFVQDESSGKFKIHGVKREE
ncbi:MAG: hypothetical protein WAN36_11335 [Calditrichia bacterium]